MKTRMKKIMALTAVMCMMMFFHSMSPVEAAGMPRALCCEECGLPFTVNVVPRVVSIQKTGACPDKSHASLGCYLCTVSYQNHSIYICNHCGTKEEGPWSSPYSVSGLHSCEVGK